MMLKSALAVVNLTVFIIPSFFNKTLVIRSTALPYVCGHEQMRSGQRQSVISGSVPKLITLSLLTKRIGFRTV